MVDEGKSGVAERPSDANVAGKLGNPVSNVWMLVDEELTWFLVLV